MATEFDPRQYELAYPDGIEHHWWQRARAVLVRREVRRVAPPGALVVDVGCGRGIEVRALRSHGVDCIGVERAAVRPLAGCEQHVFTAISAEQLPETLRSRCAAVLLLDVLEHVDEAVSFLRQLRTTFPNASSLVLTVPARPELWSNYDEFYGHRLRFTPASLRDVVEAAGLSLVRARYVFHALYPPTWLTTRLRRSRQVEIRPPARGMRVVHGVLARALVLDGLALPAWLPGTSVIATCAAP